MHIKLLTFIVLTLTTVNCVCQKSLSLKGVWVIKKVIIDGKRISFENGTTPIDTISFSENTFEQKLVVIDKALGKFLWTQKGNYEIVDKILIFKERMTSTGESGKKYPPVEFKLRLKKNEQLILGEMSAPDDVVGQHLVWKHYKKLD